MSRPTAVTCFTNCASCCREMPIALTLADLRTLSPLHTCSLPELFKRYCIVYPARSVALASSSDYHTPLSLGLPPPCPFLSNRRCSVYDFRPLICRIFPLNIHHKGTTHTYPPSDYPCMDPSLRMTVTQQQELFRTSDLRNRHLRETHEKLPILPEGMVYTRDQISHYTRMIENPGAEGNGMDHQVLERELMRERIAIGMDLAGDSANQQRNVHSRS